ncbi:MAG: NACHT domain-containing protein [Calothrix sp. C42_A2020_038]|nr:NACHT domain-containing protein [Calothrix sp. C42_A2020_038]
MLEDISSIVSTIAFFGTIVGIFAGSFQVLDQIEKRRDRWIKKLQLINKTNNPQINENLNIQKTRLNSENRIDWGEAVDVSMFYGRASELITLEKWIIVDGCRLIALLGMGGIGKTSLSVKLAQKIIEKKIFEFVIWRSLGNAPPLQYILADLIKIISLEQETDLPQDISGRITILNKYLRTSRCLLILDNFESILTEGDKAGEYRRGYEDYGELLRRVGDISHNSCLIITSREKPKEVAAIEGETLPVRSFQLSGLQAAAGEEIFQERGISGTEDEKIQLIDTYKGNPLALKIISTTIKDIFHGSISEFLAQNSIVFGSIRTLLEEQFERLSNLEKEVMYWLAINREPVTVLNLLEDIITRIKAPKLIETLESLIRRSLIEKARDLSEVSTFTLQNVVMEYMTDRLIEQVITEINQGSFKIFNTHALMKATASDYIRSSQIRLIIEPIADSLTPEIKRSGETLLQTVRVASEVTSGYAVGNIINLLVYLKINLSGYDFSGLTIKQAYLQGVNLREVNFSNCEFEKSVFTQPFGSIQSVAFSPNNILATSDTNGQIILWQVADGKQVFSIKAHLSWVWSVAFSNDGQIFASSSSDQTICLWSSNDGRCLKILQKHTNEVRSVAFHYDGVTLASGGSDHTVCIWNLNTGECIKILRGHTSVVSMVRFSPNEDTLVSASFDQTLRLWDINTGKCLKVLHGHSNQIRSVAFSYDGSIIASGSDDRTVRLWDTTTGECLKILHGHLSQVRSVTFSCDQLLFASAGQDLTIKLWNILKTENTIETQLIQSLEGHTQSIESIAFSPDNKILVSGSFDKTLRLWDVSDGKCLKTLQGYANWIWSVAFSPDGQILASGSDDFAVRFWSVSTGELLQTFNKHTNRVWSVAFSPDGQILASGSDDKTIRLWDVATGEYLKTLRGKTYHIGSLQFSPNGKILASTGADENISLWDITVGECIKYLEGHVRRVQSIAFSPDAKTLASASSDKTIKLWSPTTGECIKTIQGHRAEVNSIIFSSNGRMIASGSNDGTVKLWSGKGELIKTLHEHTYAVQSVVFSPDNKILVSASADETIKLWNVKTGECIKTLQGHVGVVWSVAIHPRGTTIASGSQDETIKLWDINTGECLNTLRAKRPYEGMNITGIKGLNEATISTLFALGAIEDNQ